ncbi:MAG: hypothetical protein R2873_28475 [Caldilineaceae bacterium]
MPRSPITTAWKVSAFSGGAEEARRGLPARRGDHDAVPRSEAHLLGYGFDPQDPELAATLFSLRQIRDVGVHSIAGSLRRIGTNHPVNGEDGPSASAAPHGRLEIGDAIALIHRAGGRAFWAHPLLYEADLAQLGGCVAELKGKGLDGLEAIYASFSDEQRADLRRLAQEHDLLVSAGTDFHAVHGVGSPTYVIDMPRTTGFRCALRCSTAQPLPRTHLIWNSLRRRIAQRRRIRPPNRITSSAVRTGCASCCLRPSPRCSFWPRSGASSCLRSSRVCWNASAN